MLILQSEHFEIEILRYEKTINILDKKSDGVCKVMKNQLIVPQMTYSFIAPYLKEEYRIDYKNEENKEEITGLVDHLDTILDEKFYSLFIADEF
jgi:hypothetical protein